MKSTFSTCVFLLGIAGGAGAEARVHSVYSTQSETYANPDSAFAPGKVAIDGDFAIAIVDYGTQRQALAWRRLSTGRWNNDGPLLVVNSPGTGAANDDVAMANGIAAIRIGGVLRIFGRNGITWTQS